MWLKGGRNMAATLKLELHTEHQRNKPEQELPRGRRLHGCLGACLHPPTNRHPCGVPGHRDGLVGICWLLELPEAAQVSRAWLYGENGARHV